MFPESAHLRVRAVGPSDGERRPARGEVVRAHQGCLGVLWRGREHRVGKAVVVTHLTAFGVAGTEGREWLFKFLEWTS